MQSTFNMAPNTWIFFLGGARVSSSHMRKLETQNYFEPLWINKPQNKKLTELQLLKNLPDQTCWLLFCCGCGCQNSFTTQTYMKLLWTWGGIMMCWQNLSKIHPRVLILFDACVKTALFLFSSPPYPHPAAVRLVALRTLPSTHDWTPQNRWPHNDKALKLKASLQETWYSISVQFPSTSGMSFEMELKRLKKFNGCLDKWYMKRWCSCCICCMSNHLILESSARHQQLPRLKSRRHETRILSTNIHDC